MIRGRKRQAGFALPSVIISALVMFTVIVTLVGSVSSVKVALDTQYYRSLARDAAESGANYAKVCLYEPTFVAGNSINPTLTCKKTSSGMGLYLIDNSAAVGGTKFRTTYTAKLDESSSDGKRMSVTGKVDLLRSSNNSIWRTYTWVTNVQMTKKVDPEGDRASKRFWYFGRFAGLDFGRSGTQDPTPSPFNFTGTVGTSGASEGATVTNDQNGNLQFWSNGLNIWNKEGGDMQDMTGNATALLGNMSAAQGGVSFPLNSMRTRYGVVSNTGSVEVGLGELYLHTIDMTLNGGNGGIIAKNRPLSPTSQTGYSAEAVSAMPNSDGSGYYVYTFNNGSSPILKRFYVGMDGKITESSSVTFSPAAGYCTIKNQHTGYSSMIFNQSYDMLAVAVGRGDCTTPNQGRIYLYSTNRMNGNLTLLATWEVENDYNFDAAGSGSGSLFAAAFSPGDRYLYVTSKYPGRLTRYKLSAKNSSAIKASEWAVPARLTTITDTSESPTDESAGGIIMTGPNNKIYMADRSYLVTLANGSQRPGPYKISVINYPNAETNSVNAIGLSIDTVTLPPGTQSAFSLPQMVTVYVPEIIIY